MLRRSKRAVQQFHPAHQALIADQRLVAAFPGPEWLAFLASLATHDQHLRRPLPPALTDTVIPLTRALSTDLHPAGALELSVDLRGDVKEKWGQRVDLPLTQEQHWRGISKIRQKVSVDPWFALRARLRDKSVLEVSVVDTTVDRKVTKRGSSGKLKIKSKIRRLERVQVRLTLPPGRVVADPGGTPPFIRIGVRQGGSHPAVSAKARFDLGAPPPIPYLHSLLLVVGEPFRWAPPPGLSSGAA